MTVYAYTRVSSAGQIDNTSLETQKKQLIGLAMSHDMEVDHVLVDPGISGTLNFFSRPAIESIDIQDGDVFFCTELTRFGRTARDILNDVGELKHIGATLITKDIGNVTDPANHIGQLILTIMAGLADYEREQFRERVRRGKEAKKDKGGFIGGQAPFGYSVQGEGVDSMLVPNGQREGAINRMKSLYRQGCSSRKIAKDIKESYQPQLKCSHMTVERLIRTGEIHW